MADAEEVAALGAMADDLDDDVDLDLSGIALIPCVRHVTDYPDHESARQALPAAVARAGYLAARCAGGEYECHLPGGGTEIVAWGRVTTFLAAEDEPADEEGALAAWCARTDDLPDGSRRVLARADHLREIAKATAIEISRGS